MTAAYLGLMAAVLCAVAVAVADLRTTRMFAALPLAVACACLLSGCGGGGHEDDPATVGPPDCKARPELCQ